MEKYSRKNVVLFGIIEVQQYRQIGSASRSNRDFLMYLKCKRIFISIAIMGIIVLDVYPSLFNLLRPFPPLPPPPPLSYVLFYPHFSCRWYIYTCICIHDLCIMYTYIHIYICIHYERHTVNTRREVYICICTRAFSDKKGLPIRLIMLNFLHNLYVQPIRNTVFANESSQTTT